MFIKICGMTSAAAVSAAVEHGVDAIGFVFAPSVRRVTPGQAAELSAGVPRTVLKVAVTQHPDQALVDEICETFAPDWLQTDIEDIEALRIPPGVKVMPVLRAPSPALPHGAGDIFIPSATEGERVGERTVDKLPSRILFEGPVSGRGTTGDWERAAHLARQSQLILAGGLNAGNVAEAIARVRPFGVDVSSGVESSPGVKDPRRIGKFVAAVRKAALGLER